MSFIFSNQRQIPAGSYEKSTPWLDNIELSELDLEQLITILHLMGSQITTPQVLHGDARFFYDYAQSFAETPVEWWNIVDETTKPCFQLWLCCADSGFLFDAGTAKIRAGVTQWSFDIDNQLSLALRKEISKAAGLAVENSKKSLLAMVDFETD